MKLRKPVQFGEFWKGVERRRREQERRARVQQQISDENARHHARVTDLADHRREDAFTKDPEKRAARDIRLAHQEAEECRRHQTRLNRLRDALQYRPPPT